jgi:UDP-2-acetamido-2,6-beta-L-arabino-hexul-4-ose reductase
MKSDEMVIVPFKDDFFKNRGQLKDFVTRCDSIVHLAAMNRGNPAEIYDCNIDLVKRLIDAVDEAKHRPHIIFSSSLQEKRDDHYGKSKREGRKLFEKWALKNHTRFTALVIPNVFGPLGKPFYNSVVATFCHQLTHDLEPKIDVDAQLELIYINDLVEIIYKALKEDCKEMCVRVNHTAVGKVSEILSKLCEFKTLYLEKNIVPNLSSYFQVCLFNTFRSYINNDHYPVYLDLHTDQRGHLAEIIKSKVGGQIFFSVTKPGITRGNHFHRRKIERFCVVEGKAVIKLRRIGTPEVIKYCVSGNRPSFVDIPVFHTHNITNTGTKDLYTLFWTNEFFDPGNSDTYYEEVR